MEGTIATYGEYIGDLLAAIRDVIVDPNDQWHKGPTACLALDDLLTDMDTAADMLSDAVHVAEPAAVSLFLRWARPVKLGDCTPDDRVGYLCAAPYGGDDVRERDAHMLAAAAVLALADYVTPDCRHTRCSALCVQAAPYWGLYHRMTAGLWLSGREHVEVDQMAQAIRKAIDARWTRRKRPTAVTRRQASQQARPVAPGEQETTMSEQPESVNSVARRMSDAVKAGDWGTALTAIDEGERLDPRAALPGGATWAKLRTAVSVRRDAAARESAASTSDVTPQATVLAAAVDAGRASVTHLGVSALPPKKATVVKVNQPKKAGRRQEPVEVEPADTVSTSTASMPVVIAVPEQPATPAPVVAPDVAVTAEAVQESGLPALTIVHTIEGGTMLLGSTREVGKQVSGVLGKNGQRWSFSFKLPHGPGWYIMGSRPGGADMPRIVAAQKALQADGFPVTLDITTTDADGKVVAPKLSAAEQARRARARSRAVDSLGWHLSCTQDGLACSSCRAPGLRPQTAKIVDDESGMSVVKCLACAGSAASVPVPQEPAAPVFPDADELVDSAEVAVVAELPGMRSAEPSGLAALDIDTLIALVKAGDDEAAAQIRRLTAQVAAPVAPSRTVRTRRPAARREEPTRSPSAEPIVADGPITLTVRLTDDAHVKKSAREVRQELYAHVTRVYSKYGVEIHVFGDRDQRVLKISATVVNATGRKRAEIANRVRTVADAVRGVESLITA